MEETISINSQENMKSYRFTTKMLAKNQNKHRTF